MKKRIIYSAHCGEVVRTYLAIAASIGTCAGVWADEASDIRAGEELAEKVCSQCHAVSQRPGPPFAEIANGNHAEPNALLALLRSTHSDVSSPRRHAKLGTHRASNKSDFRLPRESPGDEVMLRRSPCPR